MLLRHIGAASLASAGIRGSGGGALGDIGAVFEKVKIWLMSVDDNQSKIVAKVINSPHHVAP